MANSTVAALTAASALGGTELLYAVQSSNDRKATVDQIKTYVLSSPQAACATLGTWYVLATSSATVSISTGTSEVVLVTIPIPAASMGANGRLRITTMWSLTSSGNNKTTRLRFGASGAGLGGSPIVAATMTTNTGIRVQTEIMNVASASIQKSFTTNSNSGFGTTTGTTPISAAINTANASEIVLSGQPANAGETVSIESYCVEVFYSA